MLTVGQKFPAFQMKGVVSPDLKTAFVDIDEKTYKGWKIYFFWPKDFTFICPTEMVEFGKLDKEFKDRDAQVLGVSTDSEFVHHAWRTHNKDIANLPYPLLADVKRDLSLACGILHEDEGVALRATFIVDADNIIRHVSVNDLSVGRNPAEILRLLDAFQCGELCPVNWEKGQPTLKAA